MIMFGCSQSPPKGEKLSLGTIRMSCNGQKSNNGQNQKKHEDKESTKKNGRFFNRPFHARHQ